MSHSLVYGGNEHQPRPRGPGRVIPFGKYLLLERIAVGGMAEVFLAKTFGVAGFEKMIALKRILPTMAEDRDFIEMFIDEAKIAGQLSHASIVPIYELGRIGESHYIAMEYVWGKDLLQLMNRCRKLRKRMPAAMVAYIASKLCEGLDYAHNRRDRQGNPLGLIHRDISPQNVLIGYESEVKLIDFGIAKATSRNTKTQAGVLKGKFGYMSPEQIRGRPLDGRSDCFAVGTCMYEMLTSDRLFLGESDFTTLEKVRNADVRPPSQVVSVPPELEHIIMRALTREPEDRWQSAAAMHQALQVFLARQSQPFGRRELSAWMNAAFAQERSEERQRLDSYANVGRAMAVGTSAPAQAAAPTPVGRQADEATINRAPQGVPVSSPAPDLDSLFGDAADDDDETILSASPFAALLEDDPPAPSAPVIQSQAMPAEKTQVFFSVDDFDIVEEPAGAPPASKAAQAVEAIVGKPLSTPPPVAPRRSHAPVPPPDIRSRGPSIGGDTTELPGVYQEERLPQRALTPPLGAPTEQRQLPWKIIGIAAAAAVAIIGSAIAFGGGTDTGTLRINTAPQTDAMVQIDGNNRGTSPLNLELAPGSYRLTVMLAGFETAEQEINIIEGESLTRSVALSRISEETNADSAADDSPPTSPSEPQEAQNEPATPPTTEAVAEAAPAPTPAPEPPAEPAAERAPAPAQVVTSRPVQPRPVTPEARPVRSPAAVRETTSTAALPTAIPRENVRAPSREADEPREQTRPAPSPTPARREPTSPSPAAPVAAAATAAPSPSAPAATHGTLNINTIPWSNVTLDGRPIGRTPIFNRRVRAGSHRIQLETTDGVRRSFTVNVPGGENVRFTRRFE